MHHFLIHKRGDQVGVATTDITAGQQVVGVFMDDDSELTVTSLQNVPLGHKISIGVLEKGGRVIEYGIPIGIAPEGLTEGEYVHTHNIKSARW
ncbi:UxaA family hydrolase [Paenibacillus sp. URB8-2]|uniref:UxaA family hydrolase n=1 Tax=Paenibacillus sp. URB8-2 TaxID=2741301 RepID=UPI0015C0A7FE|nr:UxaA family hydrolase [Paenibacillus sp. URB8-2]BCG60709.1 dehydratase [Paenibacillus sp. URB8-2]